MCEECLEKARNHVIRVVPLFSTTANSKCTDKPLDPNFAQRHTRSFNKHGCLIRFTKEKTLWKLETSCYKVFQRAKLSSLHVEFLVVLEYKVASPSLKFVVRIINAVKKKASFSRTLVISRVVGPRRARVFREEG